MRNNIIPYNPKLKTYARELRKNSTLAEVLFWKAIKGKSYGVEFHRQVPIDEYIVDFFCHELKLVIELDGAIHAEDDVIEKDIRRQSRLEELGLKVLRIRNNVVKYDMLDALEYLMEEIAKRRQELGK
jgi:very-short-patch-repair endonuclease